MVKKISGKTPNKPTETTPIKSSESVSGAKVGSVETVKETDKQSRASRAKARTRVMTAEERNKLFELVEEEAEKLFGSGGLPEKERNKVANAVKMAIDASIAEEEDS